ncbi:MYG1 family protein [Robinsoniella peoriensis]|uniref:MYG1 family protein n=1 Tax=Robinsoniella peoriensis TaxID=180332 RepID=UPI000AD45554|nr:MYG1 family protein [Robinsoniella peoriensis]
MNKINSTKATNYTMGITHSGVFHADDVFSAALLGIINPGIKISRVFKVPDEIQKDTIVFDIGFGVYDHHQKDGEIRDNGIKYAAFGLLWREFGHLLVSGSNVQKFDETFVQTLDATDNGGAMNPLTSSIFSFVPQWDDEDQNMDSAFSEAVEFAKEILEREIHRMHSTEKAEQIVSAALAESDGEIVVLSTFVPWSDVLIPSTAKFVVFPSLRGGYSAQAIPSTINGRDQKVPFPTEWAGASSDYLQEVVPGMSFCHPGRFMVSTKTVEQAVNACKLAAKER